MPDLHPALRRRFAPLLLSLLEPTAALRKEEESGNLTARLAMMEEVRDLPFGAVWDRYCAQNNAPVGASWLDRVAEYERTALSERR